MPGFMLLIWVGNWKVIIASYVFKIANTLLALHSIPEHPPRTREKGAVIQSLHFMYVSIPSSICFVLFNSV